MKELLTDYKLIAEIIAESDSDYFKFNSKIREEIEYEDYLLRIKGNVTVDSGEMKGNPLDPQNAPDVNFGCCIFSLELVSDDSVKKLSKWELKKIDRYVEEYLG